MVRRVVMFAATMTLGLGAVGVVGVTPYRADSGTHCTFQHVPNLSPGLSFQPSNGTFTDPGGGTATCSGGLSGSGSYTDSGTVSGTCQGGGVAEGDPTFTIGGQTFTDHIRISFGQLSTRGGVVHADFEGSRTKGTIELTPTKGDCVLNPVTQIKGVGEFALK
jgi:hypothetical protein